MIETVQVTKTLTRPLDQLLHRPGLRRIQLPPHRVFPQFRKGRSDARLRATAYSHPGTMMHQGPGRRQTQPGCSPYDHVGPPGHSKIRHLIAIDRYREILFKRQARETRRLDPERAGIRPETAVPLSPAPTLGRGTSGDGKSASPTQAQERRRSGLQNSSSLHPP